MTDVIQIHPDNPQHRLIIRCVDVIREGGVVAYPTDSGYALGCHLGDKSAHDRICQIRQVDAHHNFTLLCRDLSEVSLYAVFDTPVYRLLKAHTPGQYTFILQATREVPRRCIHPRRKTIGLRVPTHRIARDILATLNEPMLTTTLILPPDDDPLADPDEISRRLDGRVDLIVDGGWTGSRPTTVVNLMEFPYRVLRRGEGDPTDFE
ncbi:threonylcarbamoyl-AMP synthase [bacterium]|nr:threonylcarbamoyl-AMP synthase [bacterium]